MNIKLLRKQIAKGEWEYVEIDIDDETAVKALEEHNSAINHKIYEEKKLFSKFSVETIESQIGHEFPDEGLDPLERLIQQEEGDFYAEREEMFDKGLLILGQALSRLTEKQKYVFEEKIKKNRTNVSIAEELKVDESYIRRVHEAALKKLRKFFLAYPEFIAYFPKLNQL